MLTIAASVEAHGGAAVYRGSESDVLERFFEAAQAHRADAILRVTADNPFFDAPTADALLALLSEGFDYVANNLERTFPYGIDLEAFTLDALAQAHREAGEAGAREHVTPFIRTRPGRFKQGSLTHSEDLSALRLTVDTPEDYHRAKSLFEHHGATVRFTDLPTTFD